MFLSKGSSRVTNSVVKLLSDNFMPQRFSSAVATSTETAPKKEPVEDKLYKTINLELRSNEPAVLKSYSTFARTAAKHLGITVAPSRVPAKPVHERLTVLKSVHVHKKHRVQYETRTHYYYMNFLRLTGSTADTFLEYLERNLSEGIAMKITKVEIQKLPEAVKQPCI